MKTRYLALFFIVVSCVVIAQEKASNFTAQSTGELQHPRNDLMNFVPNEVLIKFKDAATVNTGSRIKAAGINTVDDVLKTYGVTSLEKLFPTEQKPLRARSIKSPQGTSITLPRIDNIYRISIPTNDKTQVAPPTNIFQLIEELKALPEVEYAEPNYIYSIDNMQPVGDILTSEDVAKLQTSVQKSKKNVFTPNDPLYAQQWYIPAVKADSVWQQTTGDSTQVIAILDTGVDWNHPDLKNKIWTNPNPNSSPDANGVVNDIRGWDYINNDNNPMDDNSHGTHVAGIAAAETDNGIGIAGVNWKAKIMPLKVFQSSGRGDAATIAKGIIYASTHGATVINMSFGSYAQSLAMEDALANAYATCVLVAAAGNDDIDINDKNILNPIFYPAALSYVFGVQATQSTINKRPGNFKNGTFLTDFTNYDGDGPTYSTFDNLYNYELNAPGANILSTIPNGNYRIFQGSSMSAPIVSGSVCLYKSKHPNETQELMWGNLVNSMGGIIDINSAINAVPTPKLMFVSKTLVDTLAGDNKNGIINAGETIQLWFNIRNTWKLCDSVKVGIKFAEFEDTSMAQIIIPTALIGSVSPYAMRTNEKEPLKIHINSNAANGRDIVFTAYLYYPNSPDTVKQDIVLKINNGVELSGVMDSTMILTPDRLWLVNQSFKIGSNGKLIFKPGTKLIATKKIVNAGQMIGKGTSDSIISIIGTAIFNGKLDFEYAYFQLSGNTEPTYSCFHEISGGFNYCDFSLSGASFVFYSLSNSLIFDNCNVNGGGTYFWYSNYYYSHFKRSNLSIHSWDLVYIDFVNCNLINIGINNGKYFLNPEKLSKCNLLEQGTSIGPGSGDVYILPPNIYFGTTNSTKIENKIFDFYDDASYAQIDFKKNLVTCPFDSAHAIVWKVLVNGKDAQDEVVDPVGVGKQRFDVYFNREMDPLFTPQLTFGVRSPYNQQIVSDSGSWDSTHKIWTAYKTIKLTTGDGINRIRVAGAKEVNGWQYEIPVEDQRFEFLINAATSSSLEFMATPGLGKVKFEWNNNDLEDGLGYNMYRMEHINDSTLTSPILINSTLITDTIYTDFSVIPNKKYYYYYKVLRTNLSETDQSKVVSATPFTASKGDANGDLSVNVLDITSIVAYLLNNNPQPFIFEAADLNSDATINVLDIVGVVNKVLNGAQKVRGLSQDKLVDLFLENDTLFANSNTSIGGIQLDIKGVSTIDDIQTLKVLDGFESGNSIISDSLRLIFYSMSGKNIPAGERIPLLKLKSGSTILNAIIGETNGSPIKVNYILTRIPDIQSNMNQTIAELGQNYPNPVNGKTIIPIRIYEPVNEVILQVVNLMGQEVDVIHLENPYIGEHKLEWNPKQNKGLFIYTLKVMNGKQKNVCPAKQMIVQ